jgi:cation:H+ antiporter
MVALIVGASLLVNGAIAIARTVGISETVIGLTIVAIGTSLPELATSVVAGLRGQSDVAFGNVIGSNIFNILGILGVTSLVRPLAVPAQIIQFDIWVMLAATVAAVLFSVSGWRVSRWEGLVLLCGYAAYLGILFWPSGRAFLGLS